MSTIARRRRALQDIPAARAIVIAEGQATYRVDKRMHRSCFVRPNRSQAQELLNSQPDVRGAH